MANHIAETWQEIVDIHAVIPRRQWPRSYRCARGSVAIIRRMQRAWRNGLRPRVIAAESVPMLAVRLRGRCFDANANWIFEMNRLGATWLLCHGIPLGTGGNAKGLRYAHAWCESSDRSFVYDVVHRTIMDRASYYSEGSIKYVVRYTYEEMAKKILEYGTPGPWDETVLGAAFAK